MVDQVGWAQNSHPPLSLRLLMHFILIVGLRISGSITLWNFYWGIAYDPTRA
jgi:hypothetical protein